MIWCNFVEGNFVVESGVAIVLLVTSADVKDCFREVSRLTEAVRELETEPDRALGTDHVLEAELLRDIDTGGRNVGL